MNGWYCRIDSTDRSLRRLRTVLSLEEDSCKDCTPERSGIVSAKRAYSWGEEGLAGVSDDKQILCFAVALWNGRRLLPHRIWLRVRGDVLYGKTPYVSVTLGFPATGPKR